MAVADPNLNPLKAHGSHLHIMNLLIASIAGIISIVGGVYSIKANFFTPKIGTLQGVVIDKAIQKPLWEAPIEISESDGAIVATLKTDKAGRYVLASLKEGNYEVKVSAPRHKIETKNVKVYAKATTPVDFDLVPEEEKPVQPVVETVSTVLPTPNAQAPPPAAVGVTQPASSGQVDSDYPRRPHHRYPRRSATDEDAMTASSSSTTNSSGSALVQVASEIFQNMSNKKTDTQTS